MLQDLRLELIVESPDGVKLRFSVQPALPFARMFQAYCQQRSLPENDVVFLFNCERLRFDNTPAQLELESGDVINVVLAQVGD